jgi:hypothetical protein
MGSYTFEGPAVRCPHCYKELFMRPELRAVHIAMCALDYHSKKARIKRFMLYRILRRNPGHLMFGGDIGFGP